MSMCFGWFRVDFLEDHDSLVALCCLHGLHGSGYVVYASQELLFKAGLHRCESFSKESGKVRLHRISRGECF